MEDCYKGQVLLRRPSLHRTTLFTSPKLTCDFAFFLFHFLKTKICRFITGQILVYLIGIYTFGAPAKEKLKALTIGGTSGHNSTVSTNLIALRKKKKNALVVITTNLNEYRFAHITSCVQNQICGDVGEKVGKIYFY